MTFEYTKTDPSIQSNLVNQCAEPSANNHKEEQHVAKALTGGVENVGQQLTITLNILIERGNGLLKLIEKIKQVYEE